MIVVGYSPTHGDSGCIDLACQVARSTHDSVVAATVVPRGWPTPVAGDADRAFEQWAAEVGGSAVEESTRLLARHPDVESEAVWLSGRSVPQALLDEAARRDASMLVLGSGDSGTDGAITLTSKVERVLHSSTVPVVLTPRSYSAPTGSRITRTSLGYRGDEESRGLLEQAAQVTDAAGASLRLVTFAVRNPTMYPPRFYGAEDLVLQSWVAQASDAQERAVQHLATTSPKLAVDPVVVTGESWAAVFARLPWSDGDLLVVGSSASQPLARVFLGSSASKLVRHSPVPVVVVP